MGKFEVIINRDKDSGKESLMSINSYILANLIFYGFCILVYFIIRLLVRDTSGIGFVLLTMCGGFVLVSIFDYLYDHKVEKNNKK